MTLSSKLFWGGIIPNAAAMSNETFISTVLQYMPANTSMQGTYIPQYTQVPATNISVEVVSPVFSYLKQFTV